MSEDATPYAGPERIPPNLNRFEAGRFAAKVTHVPKESDPFAAIVLPTEAETTDDASSPKNRSKKETTDANE